MKRSPEVEAAPHAGVVSLKVNGGQEILSFSWAALSRLRDKYGEDWQSVVRAAVITADVEAIAQILGCVSERDADWWMAASPPVVAASTAIQRGVEVAFLGPEGAEPENPLNRLRRSLRI